MQPAGPASGPPSGLQPVDSVRRSTCSYLLGGRVSATGATGTSAKELSILLAGCLCMVSVPSCLMRFIFLRWRLDGCLLGDIGWGGGAF